MKTLYLLRHAKSDWGANAEDHERPLNARGRAACKAMAHKMQEAYIAPDYVLYSDAKRTTETWQRLQKAAGFSCQNQTEKKLYLATPGEMLACISKVPDTVERLMVVGHNPGIAQLAMWLCQGMGEREAVKQLAVKYPTAGLTIFEGDMTTWKDVPPGSMGLRAFLSPKGE